MADHVISLSATREDALQRIVDDINAAFPGAPGTQTKDGLLREWVLVPIKAQIRRDRETAKEQLQTSYEAASPDLQAQIRALLGL